MSVDRLLAEHVRILEDIATLEAFAVSPRPESMAAVTPVRWSLARDLMLHLVRVETEVYAPLLGDARAGAANRAEHAIREISALAKEYLAYMQRWTGSAPLADWDGYRAALRSLTARMRGQLNAEARDFMALLPVHPGDDKASQRRPGYVGDAWKIRELLFDLDPDHAA